VVAEIGDISRFSSAGHLASWCGLTPRHRESDTTVHRGSITKQGNRLIRWSAIEAAQKLRRDSRLYAKREALAERRNSAHLDHIDHLRDIEAPVASIATCVTPRSVSQSRLRQGLRLATLGTRDRLH
jgi:hypothetical protein